jgi:hypothetical protein
MLAIRFPLPMNEGAFRRWFAVVPSKNKYKQQTKIYYSSIKKKLEYHHEDDERFTTPKGKSAAGAGVSSTKLTKG